MFECEMLFIGLRIRIIGFLFMVLDVMEFLLNGVFKIINIENWY